MDSRVVGLNTRTSVLVSHGFYIDRYSVTRSLAWSATWNYQTRNEPDSSMRATGSLESGFGSTLNHYQHPADWPPASTEKKVQNELRPNAEARHYEFTSTPREVARAKVRSGMAFAWH